MKNEKTKQLTFIPLLEEEEPNRTVLFYFFSGQRIDDQI